MKPTSPWPYSISTFQSRGRQIDTESLHREMDGTASPTSPPSSDCWSRRPSTTSLSFSATSSDSSPELNSDCGVSPDTDEDDDGQSPEEALARLEGINDLASDKSNKTRNGVAIGAPTATTVPTSRKRGRPRKHPVPETKKTSHVRSKTGCGTCRRRKKKCDETKPFCNNCEKNNKICEGYEEKQLWQGGKTKSLALRRPSVPVPVELPLLVDGIEGSVDQMFFQHFTCQLGQVLSLTDQNNPFLEIIVPMAMSHTGLMHSVLYLSGSCLIASVPNPEEEWAERHRYHSTKAIRLLQEDLAADTPSFVKEEAEDEEKSADTTKGKKEKVVERISDPSIAQTFILCLQTVCAGDLTGSFRFHLNAMKEMLTSDTRTFPNEQLRQFILEFLLYHDYSSSMTSVVNSIDSRSVRLMENFALPEYMIQPGAGTLLGVLDGLFGFISRIRNLRDTLRIRRRQGRVLWWDDPEVHLEAFAIDKELRAWTCVHARGSPRYHASLLYRLCTWLYLQRTIKPSRSSQTFHRAVKEGLLYLRLLPGDIPEGSTQSILLMPLFVLGCAAFDPEQRAEIRTALDRLRDWSSLGNIKYAIAIVEEVWELMDSGRESETWDWENIIHRKKWDFLIA